MEQLFGAIPGAVSLGLVWGIMAIGLYITYKILAISDILCHNIAVIVENRISR